MNYYYDIILNWCDLEVYDFYEWNETDYLEYVKKIPLFKVKHKILLDIITNKIIVEKSFLETIYDKTFVSGKNMSPIHYAALFTDNKNVIAIEFNEEGKSISKSKLLIDDELNILECSFNLRETIFNYEILENMLVTKVTRQEKEAKHLIILELNNLYQNKDLSKLRYLYYEYKGVQSDDIEEIYYSILNDLEIKFDNNIINLYHIIKLSYHKV